MNSERPTPDSQIGLRDLAALARREQAAGRLAQAAESYRRILAIRPDSADTHNDLGIVLAMAGQVEAAIDHFNRAIALKPKSPHPRNSLGIILGQQGLLHEAAVQFRHALASKPDYAEAYNNLSNIYRKQNQLELAEAELRRALALRPCYPEALANLGNVLVKQNRFETGMAYLQQAIALRPDYPEAHKDLGAALQIQGKLDEAVACFERALALKPDWVEARFGLGECFLAKGDYRRGWPDWESRAGSRRQPRLPRWRGEPLAGRRLLLIADGGLGDTLHFFRYARVFKRRGAHVVLSAPPAFGRLLASHPDLDELFLRGSSDEPLPCDFYLPLLSAPSALETDDASIPCENPYLWAEPQLIERWSEKLLPFDGFRVGIAWQGSPAYALDHWRSVALAQLAPLARLDGVRLVSLQKGFGAEQIATAGFPVVDLADQLDESTGAFVDTAAVIRNLDLVVTVDTAIGHLAGALGAPTFLALQFAPDWRWLRGRDDSPWYPTIRLFRQTTVGQWSDVFERIAQAIGERANLKGNG